MEHKIQRAINLCHMKVRDKVKLAPLIQSETRVRPRNGTFGHKASMSFESALRHFSPLSTRLSSPVKQAPQSVWKRPRVSEAPKPDQLSLQDIVNQIENRSSDNSRILASVHSQRHHHTKNQAVSYYEKLSRGRLFSQPDQELTKATLLPSLKTDHWLQGSPRAHNRSIHTSNFSIRERSIDSTQNRQIQTQWKKREFKCDELNESSLIENERDQKVSTLSVNRPNFHF